MKFSLILLLIFSYSSWAEYRRGDRVCTDKSEEYYRQDSENLENQHLYASCLVIKGQDAQGLAMLYPLADHKSLVTSNFFIADYLETDGRFENTLTISQLNEAIKYHLRTLAIINSIPTYPEPDYWAYERLNQMELKSTYVVPVMYLEKYESGAIGDYCNHAIQSGFEKADDCPTFPEYNSYMLDNLNKVVRYARECASLPQKRHFDLNRYQATVKACSLFKELALTLLIPLEEKRQEILLQPKCADLNKTNCPEYYETHQEIADHIRDYVREKDRIFNYVVAGVSHEVLPADSSDPVQMASTSTDVISP